MDYRIFGDSCLDLTPEMKEEGKIKIVPLTLQVDSCLLYTSPSPRDTR